MERVACFQSHLLHVSGIPHKSCPDKRNFTHLLKALGKERPPKQAPYGNRCPFAEPYLAYPLESPVKKPSLQVPLIEFPQREMLRFQSPPSFIFQNPLPRSSYIHERLQLFFKHLIHLHVLACMKPSSVCTVLYKEKTYTCVCNIIQNRDLNFVTGNIIII
jgi:hypothetical protein